MVSFLVFKRILCDVDCAYNVAVRVKTAFTFVPTILRFVLTPAGGAPLRRFVRIHIDQMNARQCRLVRNVLRESVKTP